MLKATNDEKGYKEFLIDLTIAVSPFDSTEWTTPYSKEGDEGRPSSSYGAPSISSTLLLTLTGGNQLG